MKKTETVNYVIEQDLHHQEHWYKIADRDDLGLAIRTFKEYSHNVKGDCIMKEMQARMRLRKIIVVSEVLEVKDAF